MSYILPKPKTLEEALDRIEELEQLLAATDKAPLWGLTRAEWTLLQFMLNKSLATKEMLYDLLYGGLSDVELKIIDVFICKARRKLLGTGIVILTCWGRGYYLEEESKVKLRRAMESTCASDPTAVAA